MVCPTVHRTAEYRTDRIVQVKISVASILRKPYVDGKRKVKHWAGDSEAFNRLLRWQGVSKGDDSHHAKGSDPKAGNLRRQMKRHSCPRRCARRCGALESWEPVIVFVSIHSNAGFHKNYVGGHGRWIQDGTEGQGLGAGSDEESLERLCCKEEQRNGALSVCLSACLSRGEW